MRYMLINASSPSHGLAMIIPACRLLVLVGRILFGHSYRFGRDGGMGMISGDGSGRAETINNYIQRKVRRFYTYQGKGGQGRSTQRLLADRLASLNYKRQLIYQKHHKLHLAQATPKNHPPSGEKINQNEPMPSVMISFVVGAVLRRFNPFILFEQIAHQYSYLMNRSYLLLAALLVSAAVLYTMQSPSASAETSQYLAYLSKFAKPVPSGDQLAYRSKIFAEFLKTMEKHNADNTQTWKIGVNQFSDLTKEEFIQTYLGEMNSEVRELNQPVNIGFAGEVDWRTKNIVTKVKNQGQCGSCWAFGATASHESYQVQFKGQPLSIDLSEQQLVDCSTGSPYENHGCNGGYGVRALEYIKDNGQTTSSEYPYTAKDGQCQKPTGSFRPFGVAEGHGCDEIEEIIVRRPMAVRVDASNWHLYKSGIFTNCAKNINHAVFLVGSSETAWTIKNSWGTTWGEDGYIRLAKGDTCAICQGPSFAI